mmetsp:Transcript_38082/g.94667  ORF Transcript_38082/g.94667 Transcript_38082/m.94667 type:complete len:248 (-) Transcript_38082:94-837(-)
MRRRTLSHLRLLLDSLPVQPASTGIGKLRSFWSAAHDEAAIDAAGLSPLAPLLAACELFATDRAAALGRLHGAFGVCAFFSLSVAKDAHADVLRLRLQPAGLTLLSSTPYLHAEHGATRLAYVEAVGAALSLLGLGGEEAQAGGAAALQAGSRATGRTDSRATARSPCWAPGTRSRRRGTRRRQPRLAVATARSTRPSGVRLCRTSSSRGGGSAERRGETAHLKPLQMNESDTHEHARSRNVSVVGA